MFLFFFAAEHGMFEATFCLVFAGLFMRRYGYAGILAGATGLCLGTCASGAVRLGRACFGPGGAGKGCSQPGHGLDGFVGELAGHLFQQSG